jgi:septum site-determining protein MinD
VVVDFDVGLRNLDLVMGAERRVVFDLINVVQGVAKALAGADPRQAPREFCGCCRHRRPGQGCADRRGRRQASSPSCATKFDWVLCDSPAGIERGATLAMRYADEAVIVTNPEVSSVRDSDRIIGMLDSKTVKAEKGERVDKHVLITRYDPARAARGEMLSIDDILEILATPLLGIIPESQDVLRASNVGSPVTSEQRRQRAGPRLFRRGAPPDGRASPMVVPAERKGLMNRLLGRRAA